MKKHVVCFGDSNTHAIVPKPEDDLMKASAGPVFCKKSWETSG